MKCKECGSDEIKCSLVGGQVRGITPKLMPFFPLGWLHVTIISYTCACGYQGDHTPVCQYPFFKKWFNSRLNEMYAQKKEAK